MAIDHINLSRIDLNLLVAFDALMAERSVTKAAARVGLGQSAMSHNLARLRKLFDDELLTRSADGMQPTPRALALVDPVRIVLANIESLVNRPEDFDPRTAERVFRVGLPDSVEVLVGPKLLAHVCAEAPGIRFRFYSTDERRILDELDADHIDLGIGIGTFPEGQIHHKRRVLSTDSYLCMFNAGKVDLKLPISLEDYVRLPHILTSLRRGERGVVDDVLEKLGLSRKIAVVTPRFVAVPMLVASSPVITTMHARLARYFAKELGLTLSPPPIELPVLTTSLLWHASYDSDPGHVWLRNTIVKVSQEAEADLTG
ncbi:transcriptional regulator, LysR family [Filomicrobium insigne]|uniref:Transcriptional regulator, LysR family n=1 Tax=Filomicrobium insigne TaxID=418854 RepID=A0A1H0IV52_9HYPH|nr:LysR family transcriptional regulator [Filomicrobium insigne]SDO35285.1 transcriptional regulator, LysR family [Filomicrobium insigne]